MDSFSDPKDKEQIRELRYRLESLMDFLEWLFDNEMDYTSHSEMWEKYEKEMEIQDKLENTKSY